MKTTSSNKVTPADETRIAEQIVSVLPDGLARLCSDDRGSIRYSVRSGDLKLRSIVLRRSSLRRLAEDPMRAIKIEYLQRDLLASATRRGEFRYPRTSRILAAAASAKRAAGAPFMLPLASVL